MAAAALAVLIALLGLSTGGESTTAEDLSESRVLADKILHNASFLVSPSRTDSIPQTTSTALAVTDGRVVYHGDLETALKLYGGLSTELLDLGGSFVVPGFIDSHVHWLDGGLQLALLSLRGARSLEEFREAVRLAAAGAKEGEWILGTGWNENKWEQPPTEARSCSVTTDEARGSQECASCSAASCSASRGPAPQPHRSWIDDITPKNPVLLMRVDGHVALANSAALAAAGLPGVKPDPERGEVVRDAEGAITGLLREGAIGLVSQNVPPPTRAQRLEGLKRAQEEALRLGITSVVDFGRQALDAA